MDKCDEVSEISLEIEKIGIAEAITVSNDDVDHKVIGSLPSDPETGEAKSVDGQVNGTVSEASENDEGESQSSKTNGHVNEINGENEAVVNTDNSDTALLRSTECHDEIKDGDQGKRDDISIDSLDEDEFHDAVDEKSDNELGFCTQMCPESEIQFRVKNNLIHRLEEGKFMIKEYRRSAADTQDLDKPENLRSKSALSKTVSYLLKSVIRNQEFPFFDKYNFISDRIRAVRQELTIQRLSHTWFGLKVLIDCSNFYLVSRRIFINFRHEENFIDLPKFNEQHFQECIGTMIDFLKETPVEELFGTELGSTREAIAILLLASINKTASSNLIIDFIFSNLSHLKAHNVLVNPLFLFKAYHLNNWTRFSRIFHRLSRIQQITVEPHVVNIRKQCLKGCAIAFHNQSIPISTLSSWLLQTREETIELVEDSSGLEMKWDDTGDISIQFNKKEFNINNIPDDLLTTPAAGTLTQYVLYDMCQVTEYESESDLQPIITNISEPEHYQNSSTKDIASTNPLDVAKSSSDDENVPIWMRKSKKEPKTRNRKQRNERKQEHERNRTRRVSNRSGGTNRSRERPRENNHSRNFENSRHDERYNDRPKRKDQGRGNRRRDKRNGGGGDQGQRDGDGRSHTGGAKKPSTASRSWQHDDRTRTSY